MSAGLRVSPPAPLARARRRGPGLLPPAGPGAGRPGAAEAGKEGERVGERLDDHVTGC